MSDEAAMAERRRVRVALVPAQGDTPEIDYALDGGARHASPLLVVLVHDARVDAGVAAPQR